MRTIKKISALLLAVLLLAALGMSAAAAEAFVYDPVNGDATSFTFIVTCENIHGVIFLYV